MGRDISFPMIVVVFTVLISLVLCCTGLCKEPVVKTSAAAVAVIIVSPKGATFSESLAAKEVRRYLYLRTGKLLPVVQSGKSLPCNGSLIVIGQKDRDIIKLLMNKDAKLKAGVISLKSQQYQLKTLERENQQITLIAGGDSVGTLYGAYRFIEHFGVRFFLHGDTIPDERISLRLPEVDEIGKPLFNLRGILPFHDFPEGPDWWNVDDYKAVISQLAKLRMNLIGLHTYPQSHAGPEPTVWIGLAEDMKPDGTVDFSSESSYANTLRGNWGYAAKRTGQYNFGCSQLFERDDFGAEVMFGMMPWPGSIEQNNELFNRVGKMLKEVFEYAGTFGVKTCVGTEVTLTIPDIVKERMRTMAKDPSNPSVVLEIYEGMFRRIMRTHPLDYYWLWTEEGWTWKEPSDKQVDAVQRDLQAAVDAAEKIGVPFTLATCGWVLGPPKDRAQFDRVLPKEMPFSCINREVGKAPVEPQFAKIKGRPKWAIPWLEDDPGMISSQLWVGRMRKDAADALEYGCSGLMGIHWRTRILGPSILALAKAGWDQSGWKKNYEEFAEPSGPVEVFGGQAYTFDDASVEGTEDDELYQDLRYRMSAYRLLLPNGKYNVKLQFQEPCYDKEDIRIFGIEIQGQKVIDRLDIFAQVGKNKALDYTFEDIEVADGVLVIDFVRISDGPVISGIVVEGQGVSKKINCGGEAYKDYTADPEPVVDPRRFMPTDDFYRDWAVHQFGRKCAEQIAAIFTKIDGRLHEPAYWQEGPGAIATNNRPWSKIEKHYAFVDELAKLQPKIKGAGNKERFNYWLNSFQYMQAMAKVGCTLGKLDKAVKLVKDEQDNELKSKLARDTALPLRKKLVKQWGQMVNCLSAAVSTTGGMGTVANIEQHSMGKLQLLNKHDKFLEQLLGEALPADTKAWKDYRGPARIIVPTVRSNLIAGEDLKLKVIILSKTAVRDATLYWQPMGSSEKLSKIALTHVARGVYSVTIAADKIKNYDLEYYIKASLADERRIYFPANAPQLNQTVIVIEP